MAWWSLYLWFRAFRKTPYQNMIHWYKLYLHEQWFESLSEEDKQKVLAYRERKKREREASLQRALFSLGMMHSIVMSKAEEIDRSRKR